MTRKDGTIMFIRLKDPADVTDMRVLDERVPLILRHKLGLGGAVPVRELARAASSEEERSGVAGVVGFLRYRLRGDACTDCLFTRIQIVCSQG